MGFAISRQIATYSTYQCDLVRSNLACKEYYINPSHTLLMHTGPCGITSHAHSLTACTCETLSGILLLRHPMTIPLGTFKRLNCFHWGQNW